jgi:hypothetical protein
MSNDNDTRPVREILGEIRYQAMVMGEAGDDIAQLALDAADALAAASASPWRRRPSSGWTAETLPESTEIIIFIYDGMVQIGNFSTEFQTFVGEYAPFDPASIEAWMYVPEYVDAPADLDASAEPA